VSDSESSGVVTSFTYTYDADGNPTTVVTPSETDTYTYSTRDFLTGVCYGSSCSKGEITYAYDGDGNRTSMTVDGSTTTTYAYNSDDELTSATVGSTVTKYANDADGDRTSAGSNTFSWNAAGELVSSDVSGVTTKYTYNGDGMRATSVTSGVATAYVFDVNNPVALLAEESQSGTEADRYVYGDNLLLSMRAGSSDYYVSHDALGSTVALTSASGTVDTTFLYDPYGNIRSEDKIVTSAPVIPLTFEAQLLDPDGLYQLQARDLDPATGEFLSADPLAQPLTSPQLSSYIYAGDQPTVLWDPSGQCADEYGSGWWWSPSSGWVWLNDISNTAGPWLEAAGFVSFGDTVDDILNVAGGASDLYTLYQINSKADQAEQAANQDLNNAGAGSNPDSEQYYYDQISGAENYEQNEVNPLSLLSELF
jgi:RHS repeat-associated protein